MNTKKFKLALQMVKDDATREVRYTGNKDDDYAAGFTSASKGILPVLEYAATRIAALETEIEALKNPPYRIVIEKDPLQRDGLDFPYRAVVMCGDHELPFDGDWHKTEAEAKAEAQTFIDKLTPPFERKE